MFHKQAKATNIMDKKFSPKTSNKMDQREHFTLRDIGNGDWDSDTNIFAGMEEKVE